MVILISILLFLLAMSLLRIFIGPTIWDRLLGLNMVASKLVMIIVLYASLKQSLMILDLALLYVLLGFIGIIFISVYIQRRGRF